MTATKTPAAEPAYTLQQAADLKQVSTQFVRKAIRAGALPAKIVGKGYRIDASDLQNWWKGLPDA